MPGAWRATELKKEAARLDRAAGSQGGTHERCVPRVGSLKGNQTNLRGETDVGARRAVSMARRSCPPHRYHASAVAG